MKQINILLITCMVFSISYAQDSILDPNIKVDYQQGIGLTIDADEGKNILNIGGYIVPAFLYTIQDGDDQNELGIGASRIHFDGSAIDHRFVYYLDANFMDPKALLDAYVGMNIINKKDQNLLISVGQKRTFTNSREGFMYLPDVAFYDRSPVSSYFMTSGREMGLFLEGEFLLFSKIGIKPMAMVSSGDGRNSFGANSTDPDVGGLKYGGRLDVLPFGFFENNGDYTGRDFSFEKTPKLAVGSAYSFNKGASGPTGEGHDEFSMFAENGNLAYPDYMKFYADFILKYKGFTVLGEYVSSATNTNGVLYTDANASTLVNTSNIGSFLALGQAFNTQAGYIFTKSKVGIDIGFSKTYAEFDQSESLVPNEAQYTVALSKFITKYNAVKFQFIANYIQQKTTVIESKDIDFFHLQFVAQLKF